MNHNKKQMREWAERLEQGKRDDELLSVAARLEEARLDEASAPPIEFQRQLRRDLLGRYPATPPARSMSGWVGSLASLGLIVALVFSLWLSLSSAGRSVPGEEPGNGAPPATSVPTLPLPARFTLLDYAISGGIDLDVTGTNDTESGAISRLVPSTTAEITTRWRIPAGMSGSPLFSLHLVNSEGQIVAQSDAPVQLTSDSDGQTGEAVVTMVIPANLPPGGYELIGGLFDAASSERLVFTSMEGEELWTMETDLIVAAEGDAGTAGVDSMLDGLPGQDASTSPDAADWVAVTAVSPAGGTVVSGTAPIVFTITLDYQLSSQPEAILEVRVTEVQGEGGRGVGLATVEGIAEGSGTTTVVVVVDPVELPAAADLGLLLQLKADPGSAPLFMDLPDAYRWRYTP